MNTHLSKQFDLELENIRTRILQMGGLVERQVLAAIEAFGTGNIEEMQQVIRNDRKVDAYEVGIDEDCTLLIARRQPTARDLRLVMAISRIVTDLERSGDKAAKIANKSRKVYRAGARRIPRISDVEHCGQLATDMLHGALDAQLPDPAGCGACPSVVDDGPHNPLQSGGRGASLSRRAPRALHAHNVLAR